ncbi:MAG: DNA polymerase III subunit chi [Glaciecola sp.]|jgi:DNA polymerase-3 subunit chi
MTQVVFYQLTSDHSDSSNASPEHVFACELVAHCYRKQQKLSVLCADKAQAETFDELLWQLPADSFIAHNLAGEGPAGGAPVEITWGTQSALRNIVVNLAFSDIAHPQRYQTIYDFVPVADVAKQAARERYKYFKLAGCDMQFQQAESLHNPS